MFEINGNAIKDIKIEERFIICKCLRILKIPAGPCPFHCSCGANYISDKNNEVFRVGNGKSTLIVIA